MLDMKLLRENFKETVAALNKRGGGVDLGRFEEFDDARRRLLAEAEKLRAERNTVSALIGRTKDKSTVQDEMERMKKVGTSIQQIEAELAAKEHSLNKILMTLPNIPHVDCPVGAGENENVEVRRWGKIPEFSFKPKNHWTVGEDLGILDFERGVKIASSRFVLYRGAGARLERALINFMLDLHTDKHGYMETLPPFLVNRDSMTGTGQLPKFEEDLFRTHGVDLFLIPTAEVPVTNIHRDEILAEDQLTMKYAAYTPCFRKEAGAHGKDTRGLVRLHQFNKVELVKFAKPEESDAELQSLLGDAEKILQLLELPYRVVDLCTADIGFSAARTFDIEVWLPGQECYREISSCSNFRDFQARRAGIRFRRNGGKKPEFVHTLNGSGLAVGRTVVAILENYQLENGDVIVPEVLRPYMGGLEVIKGA